MASSLSEACTPLKLEYDACFNAWFEGYLEPVVSATPAQRTELQAQKAAEYESKCGAVWAQYRDCVQKAVQDKGLTTLLDDARRDEPLKTPPPLDDRSP